MLTMFMKKIFIVIRDQQKRMESSVIDKIHRVLFFVSVFSHARGNILIS